MGPAVIPLLSCADKRREYLQTTVRYNSAGQKLDIWARRDVVDAPVLMFIPGGAWLIGHRRPQGYALMSHLVEQGYVCVAIDYRTAPMNRWPTPYLDVRDAYWWAIDNIENYGGDYESIAVAGASAGGHMASLLGLAWDYPELGGAPYTPAPAAVISFYGVYDWTDRHSPFQKGFGQFLERVVVGKSLGGHPHIFSDASPISHVRSDAPPFMIVHGTADAFTPLHGARRFNGVLAGRSLSAVVYNEIPGAVHGFDMIRSRQTDRAVERAGLFLAGAGLLGAAA